MDGHPRKALDRYRLATNTGGAMKDIDSVHVAVLRQARAMLGWPQPHFEISNAPVLLGNDVDTAVSAHALVVTPAQDLAFFARSSAWRCTSCGKVHSFAERVSVVFASPCVCTSIEFEPQRGDAFAVAVSSGLALSGASTN